MTDWDIVKDTVVLVGLIVTVTTPLLKLNTSITQLKSLLDSVVKQVQDNDRSNSTSHKRLWEHNEEQDEILHNHEMRLHDFGRKITCFNAARAIINSDCALKFNLHAICRAIKMRARFLKGENYEH